MLSESPIHFIDSIRVNAQNNTLNKTFIMWMIALSKLVSSVDNKPNKRSIQTISAETKEETLARLNNITRRLNHAKVNKFVEQYIDNPEMTVKYLDKIEGRLITLYKEFGIPVHNDM